MAPNIVSMSSCPSAAVAATAETLIATLDACGQLPPLTRTAAGLSLPDAYRISRAVTARRRARGERVVGRKIGFTNRTIWDEYGVHHPIDGPMYDTTVRHVMGPATASLARFVEPRIEPEIVLGFASAPRPGMDEAAILGCVAWVAHGFEIVQSLFPGWIFGGADCVAAFGLHGALCCGPKVMLEPADRSRWLRDLTAFEIMLAKDGHVVDRGQAVNVLGGPLSALSHLVEAIAADPDAEPVAAGDIVTTGTVTRAFPLLPGERWTTVVSGLPLPGMDVTFSAWRAFISRLRGRERAWRAPRPRARCGTRRCAGRCRVQPPTAD
jgi:2-oxo-3-hexenedioate decarboxylase